MIFTLYSIDCLVLCFKKTTENKTQQWNVSSDLWKTKKLSEEHFWFLNDESKEETHLNNESKEESLVDDMSSAGDRLDDINHLEHVSLIIRLLYLYVMQSMQLQS